MAPATPRRLESPGSTSNEMAPLIENQPATGIFTLSPGTISTPCVDVSNTARQFRPAGPVLYIASASESFARGNCRPSCVDERPGPPPLRVPARTIVKSAPMAFALSMTFFSSAVYADTYSPPAQMSGLEKSFAPLMRKPSPSPLPSRPEAPLRLMNTIFFTLLFSSGPSGMTVLSTPGFTGTSLSEAMSTASRSDSTFSHASLSLISRNVNGIESRGQALL
mmetsp:Transcript_91762/g.262357  ORF Transcript_91762/g.262357 Transcript_91762/m.262357 type:complete len:222 (-) Transcript_91762:308-973(-)